MRSRLVAVPELALEERRAMHALMAQHFEGVGEERFLADLAAKQWAILLEAPDGTLAGLSTLRLDRGALDGTVDVVTSGDTVVTPAAWRSTRLAPAWISAVRHLRGRRRLLWLLVVSGFRTYRFLPVFFREFYPRHDRATPPGVRRVVDRLSAERFGEAYDPATGIVRFAEPQCLRPALGGIPPGRRRDPHVAFFERTNPHHADGDELVCLAEVEPTNLTPAARRMVRKGERLGLEVGAPGVSGGSGR